MYRYFVTAMVVTILVGCGDDGGSDIGVLSFHVTRIEENQDVTSVTFGIEPPDPEIKTSPTLSFARVNVWRV